MPSKFERDTAVVEIGTLRYEGVVSPDWWVVAGPNGGYLAAIVTRALQAAFATATRRMRSLSLHYLRPAVAGPIIVEIEVVKAGKLVTTVQFFARQDSKLVMTGLSTFGVVLDAPSFSDAVAPLAPPPVMVSGAEPGIETIPMGAQYDVIPCLGSVGSTQTGPNNHPEQGASSEANRGSSDAPSCLPAVTGGWIRLADPAPIDECVLAAYCDSWWPPVFHRINEPLAVPTVELTLYFQASPTNPHGWVLGQFQSTAAREGYIVETGELWDESGALLATVHQLAVLR